MWPNSLPFLGGGRFQLKIFVLKGLQAWETFWLEVQQHAGAYLENNTTVGPESEARERLYDEEYNIHDDFIFENMEKFKSGVSDKDDPRLDKEFRSTSTAELTPKVEDLKAKGSSMPPQTVMFKLISVMTFRKLIRNPNTYSSLIGLVWSLISYRCVHSYRLCESIWKLFWKWCKRDWCVQKHF